MQYIYAHDFVMTTHHVNTPVSFVPPYTTLLHCKTGVYMGIPYFYVFAPIYVFALKHRDYSLEPPLTLTYNRCFEQKYKKKNIIIFTALKCSNDKLICLFFAFRFSLFNVRSWFVFLLLFFPFFLIRALTVFKLFSKVVFGMLSGVKYQVLNVIT